MPNLAFLICSNLRILDKIQRGVFSISGFLRKSPLNNIFCNWRTSYGTDIKFGLLPKLGIKNTMT